jgi:hypothetical protein
MTLRAICAEILSLEVGRKMAPATYLIHLQQLMSSLAPRRRRSK